MNGINRRGTNAIEMGNESGMDGSISEVAFHHAELALSAFFPPIELDSLVLYCLKFTLMHSIPVYVSNNTRVLEIYNGVVDEESGHGRGMKNVEVVILDPRAIEIGGGVCTRVEGNGVFGVPSLADPYNVSVNPNLPKSNVSRYLVLSVLIEEDKGVLLCITTVVLTPSSSWMVRVVEFLSELGNVGDGTRCGRKGDSGIIRSKSDRLITLNIFI